MVDLAYQQHATCATPQAADSDFSPTDTRGRLLLDDAREVAQHCAVCPVRAECLAHALELRQVGYPPEEIIWAGIWWPAKMAADRRPIDLLGAIPARIEAAA